MMMRGPLVALAFAVLAASCFLLALIIFGPVFLWGESVSGRVDEVRHSGHSSQSCTPVISYEVAGETHVYRSSVWSSPCAFVEGEVVTVRYPRNNPSNGLPDGGGSTLGLLMLIVGGLVLSYQAVRAHLRGSDQPDAGAERPELDVVPLAKAPMHETIGLRGIVKAAGDVLEAPLTGRPCIAYEVEVRSPIFGEEGELIHRASAHVPFTLHEDDGTVATLREAATTDVDLAPDRRGNTESEPNERLVALLKAAGFDSYTATTPTDDYHWSEGIVRAGDRLTVYAQLTPAPEATTGYRKGGQRFIIEAPANGKVILATMRSPRRHEVNERPRPAPQVNHE